MYTFPKEERGVTVKQWLGFKELLENRKCYLAAKILVMHSELNDLLR